MTSILGPYSTSSALSTTHYKLVQALESARSPAVSLYLASSHNSSFSRVRDRAQERDTILDTCLHDIEDRWSRSQPKPVSRPLHPDSSYQVGEELTQSLLRSVTRFQGSSPNLVLSFTTRELWEE